MTGQEFICLGQSLCHLLIDYKFKPTEIRLLLIMKEETLDAEKIEGTIDLDKWAKRLRGDGRPDKLKDEVWNELVKSQVVDPNYAQGTYRLRPDPISWSKDRGMRRPEENLRTGQELNLTAARPLSDAMSDLSLDAALQKGSAALAQHGVTGGTSVPAGSQASGIATASLDREVSPADFARLRGDLDNFATAVVADKSATMDKSATGAMADKSANQDCPVKPARDATADLSATALLASYQGTVQKAKLAKGTADLSAKAWHWLAQWDRNETLKAQNRNARRFAQEWQTLCERQPKYVLDHLKRVIERPHVAERMRKDPGWDPLAFLAGVARKDAKFVRPNRP